MRSTSQHSFAQVASANIERSAFDRSHGLTTTLDAGFLVPMYVEEILPGDSVNLTTLSYGRFATPIHPIMHNVHMDFHYFFVPNRLVWTNWKFFMGEKLNPGDTTEYLIPIIDSGSSGAGFSTIYDYMGIPPGALNKEFNALPFRCYNLIYQEWFKPQDIIDAPTLNIDDGPDPLGDVALLRRAKRHDYFTSCLPAPQKGAAVELPLGLTAPVVPEGTGLPTFDIASTIVNLKSSASPDPLDVRFNTDPPDNTNAFWDDPHLETDLSSATAATINQIRMAFQIQKLLERDQRSGTRYQEVIKAHFGVTSPDARLNRPEYLGGGTQQINFTPVPQTSRSDAGESPQGNLAAFGVTGGSQKGFSKSFTEHGYIIGLVSIRADLTYQRGLHKMFNRKEKYDFFWPALSHIGEQAVTVGEIYAVGDAQAADQDDEVFGYQERWAEYRYAPSRLSGKMRSLDAATLDAWHLSQDFAGTKPTLSQSFIEEDPPVDRVVAVASEPHLLLDLVFKVRHVRPIPTNSTPGLIDHF